MIDTFGTHVGIDEWRVPPHDVEMLELVCWWLTPGDSASPTRVVPALLADDDPLVTRALEAQRRGELDALDSPTVIEGASCGIMATRAAAAVLPPGAYPDLQGDARRIANAVLYRAHLYVDCALVKNFGRYGEPLLYRWRLARAVAAACRQEILDRLQRSAVDHEIAVLYCEDDGAALDRLLNRILPCVQRYSFYRSASGREEQSNSAKYDLCFYVEEIISGHAADVLPEAALDTMTANEHEYVVLTAAMDSKFRLLPLVLQRRQTDRWRAEMAQKRGGETEYHEDPGAAIADCASPTESAYERARYRELCRQAMALTTVQFGSTSPQTSLVAALLERDGLTRAEAGGEIGRTTQMVGRYLRDLRPLIDQVVSGDRDNS